MKILYRTLVLFAMMLSGASSQAQDFPNRPIRMIVPFPPGGVTDIVARTMAAKLSDELGQQIICENRSGASGAIGAEAAARSPADGYTWVMGNISTLAINQWTMAKLGYDPIKSFEPLGMVAVQPLLVVVNPALPVNTLAELVAYAKAHPGELNYGTAGTSIHLAVELFSTLAGGIRMKHIPYKGSSPAITDLLGGQIEVLFDPFSSIAPQVVAGKVRALAITSQQRSGLVPEVPTVIESGYAGYDVSSWQGLLAPAGTPKEIVDKINRAINKVLSSQDVKEKFAQYNAVPTLWTTTRFVEFIEREQKRWGEVASQANVKPE